MGPAPFPTKLLLKISCVAAGLTPFLARQLDKSFKKEIDLDGIDIVIDFPLLAFQNEVEKLGACFKLARLCFFEKLAIGERHLAFASFFFDDLFGDGLCNLKLN